MIKAKQSAPAANVAAEKLIVAIDCSTASEALRLIEGFDNWAVALKIGLQLFSAEGPRFVEKLCGSGRRVFLDLKLHDIPNTVAKAAAEAAKLGLWMLNVHAFGGREMMMRTRDEVQEACSRQNIKRPALIAVTVLTSSDANTLVETGIESPVEDQVSRLARLTAESGLDGVVASPLEIGAIRGAVQRPGFLVVTPGVRPHFAPFDDQKRVMSPGEAFAAGADYLVIGRPVTAAVDPSAALHAVLEEMSHTNVQK